MSVHIIKIKWKTSLDIQLLWEMITEKTYRVSLFCINFVKHQTLSKTLMEVRVRGGKIILTYKQYGSNLTLSTKQKCFGKIGTDKMCLRQNV